MCQHPDNVQSIVLACVVLHNYLRAKHPEQQNALVDAEVGDEHAPVPGRWRNDDALATLPPLRGNTALREAKTQRDTLKDYYNSDAGKVPWQDAMI